MFKRIITYILCAAMALPTCGCGGEDSSSDSSSEVTTVSTTVSAAAESEAESDTASEADPEPAKGSTSLFIYLCGSDLETKQSIATIALKELLTAEVPDDMNIIIQTGGAKKWRNFDISPEVSQRYEVRNGELKLIESLSENKNMGDSATLADFASWCDTNYRSERNMMLLWDHGAGSARGVCFDENNNYDPLTLSELGDAFKTANLKSKYDILGFDACLMATFETAISVKDYADYMIASQDIEPSCGWGLKTVAETFSKESDAAETGKIIVDDFIERCKEKNKNDFLSTLSVFDLSKTDTVIDTFNAVMKLGEEQNYASEKKDAGFINAMRDCEHFGGNSLESGYSNMLDLVDLILCLGVINDTTVDLIDAVSNEFVTYYANCGKRNNFGVSFYCPFVYNAQEIENYLELNINGPYNEILKSIYLNIPDTTVEFADRGSIADNGAFQVTLTPESSRYAGNINYILMTVDENGKQTAIAADNDIHKDWENLNFKSNFRGITLAMNGHPMFYKTITGNDSYITFSTPIKVNGEIRDYRFSFIWNSEEFNGGHYLPGGLWGGYDENGIPSKDTFELKPDDKIQVATGITMGENGKLKTIFGEEFVLGDKGEEITELPLDGKIYQYYFVVTDIFGNQFASDTATFEMTKTYEELLNDPLPDGEYAAKVTNITEYDPEKDDQ
ncbi:hypothetical protein SAMN02910317_02967 [Ruminococcaceae bacterium FB2012]|nr:hypothetical protein SAMN02910317_02967 [Ruminococcaceae bacterium FB2012]